MNEENSTPNIPPDQPPAIDELLHKTLHHKRRFSKKLLLFVIAVIILLSGAIIALLYLAPKDPTVKGGDIKMGDRTVTRQQIADYSETVKQYLEANPDTSFKENLNDPSKTPDEIATDDLILNAALKNYAKQFNVIVTNKDVLESAGTQTQSIADADARIDAELGLVGSLARVRNENVAYKLKLSDSLLAKKNLLQVRITIDTPYFNGLNAGSKVQTAYDSAKKQLQDKFLPLFQQKLAAADIAKVADVNATSERYTSPPSEQQKYFNGPVSYASIARNYTSDGTFYNNLDTTDWIRGDIGKVYSADEKIATLNNVGDYTDVFASKTGGFVIFRLESKTSGEFTSWDQFLKKIKETYAYTPTAKTIASASQFVQSTTNGIVTTVGKAVSDGLGGETASALSAFCSQHLIDYQFTAVETTTQTQIAGVALNFSRSSGNDCWAQMNGGNDNLNVTISSKASGAAVFQYNCYGSAPYYNGFGNDAFGAQTAVNGYDATGIVSNGHSGWPDWSNDNMNETRYIPIRFNYKKQWTR